MYIADHAQARPDHPALINGATGEVMTYRELDERSNRLANLLCAHGLRRGDHIALFLENNMRFMEVCWAKAVQRYGMARTSSRLSMPARAAR
jgi:long-chain acyl-CoA synthetase